jgi:hypothetical protein
VNPNAYHRLIQVGADPYIKDNQGKTAHAYWTETQAFWPKVELHEVWPLARDNAFAAATAVKAKQLAKDNAFVAATAAKAKQR